MNQDNAMTATTQTQKKTLTMTTNKGTAKDAAATAVAKTNKKAASSTTEQQEEPYRKPWSTSQVLLAIIISSCVLSGIFNIIHAHYHDYDGADVHHHAHEHGDQRHHKEQHAHAHGHGNAIHQAMHDFMKGMPQSNKKKKQQRAAAVEHHHDATDDDDEEDPEGAAAVRGHNVDAAADESSSANTNNNNNQQQQQHAPPSLAKLSCEKYGGPLDELAAQEMVYWKDIPSDNEYVSPFHPLRKQHSTTKKYMTFEPDGGGWNNIRMALETVLGLAIAMGRTLVLPPDQRLYLLAKDRDKQKTHFGFADFFPMHELAAENKGLDIITMEQFLEAEAMTGHLRNKETGVVEFPPNNRTDWNGGDIKLLKEWLRNVTHTPIWAPESCMAAFPASGDHKDIEQLHQMVETIHKNGVLKSNVLDTPTPVDASPLERMRESLRQRANLCVYDEDMQEQPVVHFMCYHKLRVRMLVHFYAFLYFEDWREDTWMKRFMRDHVRYVDEIQCAAARIVQAMREYASSRGGGGGGDSSGDFHTFHIRRGDFQFKKTRIEASEIYANVQGTIPENSTVFIATDERDKKFFDVLREHYDIKFLDDFKHLLKDVNTNHFGMIDQLVASRGKVFFGCWHSTFTGFIMRVRGYHSTKDKLAGYEKGLLPTSYYYVLKDKKEIMHQYAPLNGAFFNREFPTSWRDIDKGIGNHPGLAGDLGDATSTI